MPGPIHHHDLSEDQRHELIQNTLLNILFERLLIVMTAIDDLNAAVTDLSARVNSVKAELDILRTQNNDDAINAAVANIRQAIADLQAAITPVP